MKSAFPLRQHAKRANLASGRRSQSYRPSTANLCEPRTATGPWFTPHGGRDGVAEAPADLRLRLRLRLLGPALRRMVACGPSISLAHISALLGRAVPTRALIMIGVRLALRVDPDHGIGGAARLRFRLGSELAGAGRASRRLRRRGLWLVCLALAREREQEPEQGGRAAGAGAGAAAGVAAAGVAAPAFCVRHCARNCCHVMPLVVLFALAAFHSSPHCFMMLCASAAPVVAKPKAPARKRAESAILIEVLIIANPFDAGAPALSPAPSRADDPPSSFLLMPLFH